MQPHIPTTHKCIIMYRAIKIKEEYMYVYVLNAAFMYFEVKHIITWQLFSSMQ